MPSHETPVAVRHYAAKNGNRLCVRAGQFPTTNLGPIGGRPCKSCTRVVEAMLRRAPSTAIAAVNDACCALDRALDWLHDCQPSDYTQTIESIQESLRGVAQEMVDAPPGVASIDD